MIDVNISFAMKGDNIHLKIAEVLLRTAAGNLAKSKKQREWNLLNTVLLPPFLTEAAILNRETSMEDLLKTFVRTITEISAV